MSSVPVPAGAGEAVDVSICMVSLNCWQVLEPCLETVRAQTGGLRVEVIVVDNDSKDGTVERLATRFPEVSVVRNEGNVGFTRATNQGLAMSRGRHLLWLNTDTLLEPDTIATMVRFLDAHDAAGIVGPKVLNPDGSFQAQCRRGSPTPLPAMAYLTGLSRLFPHSRTLNEYMLSYLPVDQPAIVAAVSGCCLMAKRAVLDDIGPLDDRIFGFGEDLDWCVRSANAGWQVWYYPTAQIVHLKGQGGVHSKPYHKAWGIHQAMWIFFQTHLAKKYAPPVRWLIGAGIAASFGAAVGRVALARAGNRLSRLAGSGSAARGLS